MLARVWWYLKWCFFLLEVFALYQHTRLLMISNSFMTDKFMPLSEAVEGYEIFNDMKVQKVVFVPEHND